MTVYEQACATGSSDQIGDTRVAYASKVACAGTNVTMTKYKDDACTQVHDAATFNGRAVQQFAANVCLPGYKMILTCGTRDVVAIMETYSDAACAKRVGFNALPSGCQSQGDKDLRGIYVWRWVCWELKPAGRSDPKLNSTRSRLTIKSNLSKSIKTDPGAKRPGRC